jgi:glycosyltransferase involved in cell wall biosynthesis
MSRRGLVDEGADVEVIVAHPTEAPEAVRNYAVGVHENVRYRYVLRRSVRRRNLLARKLMDTICHFAVVGRVLFNSGDNDLIIVVGPSFDFRILLPVVALLSRARIVLEINEYPFVTRKDGWTSRAKRWLFLSGVVPLYDGFVVISDALANLVKRHAKEGAGVINIPVLGTDTVHESVRPSLMKSRYIIHSGSLHEEKDGVVGILRAYRLAKARLQEPIKFVITGNAASDAASRSVVDFIQRTGLEESVVFTGFLSPDSLENYLRGSALAIVNKYKNVQNAYCFSTKLTDYLRYGVPIIATAVGELQVYLKSGENALLVDPGDTAQLADAIVEVLQNKDATQQRVRSAYELIRNDFNYKHQGKSLHAFLTTLLRRG